MIDPKFNELPATPAGVTTDSSEEPLSEQEETAPRSTARGGLSINDTVASDANLSVGSRGTDTSGVRAGSGAGAGTSYVTAGTAGSPAPNVVPGSPGSGTTPISTSSPGQTPTIHEEATSKGPESSGTFTRSETAGEVDSYAVSRDDIAAHAYRCWLERGCPAGSPEEDWNRAERELRERSARRPITSTASA